MQADNMGELRSDAVRSAIQGKPDLVERNGLSYQPSPERLWAGFPASPDVYRENDLVLLAPRSWSSDPGVAGTYASRSQLKEGENPYQHGWEEIGPPSRSRAETRVSRERADDGGAGLDPDRSMVLTVPPGEAATVDLNGHADLRGDVSQDDRKRRLSEQYGGGGLYVVERSRGTYSAPLQDGTRMGVTQVDLNLVTPWRSCDRAVLQRYERELIEQGYVRNPEL